MLEMRKTRKWLMIFSQSWKLQMQKLFRKKRRLSSSMTCLYTLHFVNGSISYLITNSFNLQIRTLTEENAKLQYRLIHLARSLKEANLKLEQVSIADVSFNGFG